MYAMKQSEIDTFHLFHCVSLNLLNLFFSYVKFNSLAHIK